ncbi:MAG: hypothetical protein HFH47_01555 [Bacilli bacterium]|nr:hypothetical protein [Bacilli bacterium]
MVKKLFKTLCISFVIICGTFFIDLDGAKADIPYCEINDKFEKAVSCDYPNKGLFTTQLDLTVYFGKTTSGKYCAEIKNVQLTSWVDFNNSDEQTNKQKVAFDLNNETMNNTLTQNVCPKLKFVNDYNASNTKTTKFTVSDKDMNGAACTVSQLVSFGSECWVLPGENFKQISSTEMETTIQESTNERDINNIEKIKQWGEENKSIEELDNIGDGCGAISAELRELISTILWIIDIIAILILIIMTMINLIQAITGSDSEKFKDVFKHARVRIIAVVLLLLLPVLVGGIIDLINDNADGEVKIGADGKPFCDIEK